MFQVGHHWRTPRHRPAGVRHRSRMKHTILHIIQIIVPVLIVLAFIGVCIKAPRQTIGGVIGGVLGVAIPFLCSLVYVWRGGDPTAAGVFSFFCILTLPLGIAIGVLVATMLSKRGKKPENDRV